MGQIKIAIGLFEGVAILADCFYADRVWRETVYSIRANQFVSLTTSKDSKCGSVVLCHPVVSELDKQPDGSRCRVEVCDLESLDHLPVAPWGRGTERSKTQCHTKMFLYRGRVLYKS